MHDRYETVGSFTTGVSQRITNVLFGFTRLPVSLGRP